MKIENEKQQRGASLKKLIEGKGNWVKTSIFGRVINEICLVRKNDQSISKRSIEVCAVSIPKVNGVSCKKSNKLYYQGEKVEHTFYSDGEIIGSLETELWEEKNIILVHSIEAMIPYQKQGTAMIKWLFENYQEVIKPVHVYSTAIPFWEKMEKLFNQRISSTDLRSSEYDDLLKERRTLFIHLDK
jgi:hypothetical protein